MNYANKKLKIAILLLGASLTQISFASGSYTMQINASKTQLKVGEPLIMNIAFRFEQPQMSPVPNKVRSFFNKRHKGLYLQILCHNDGTVVNTWKGLPPRKFYMQDTEGLEYAGYVEIFYDWSTKNIIFKKPGAYTISVLDAKKQSSNSVNVFVASSYSDEKALSLLSDPNDFAFLLGGVYKSPETVSHLRQVVDQCKGILLAKWCATRLGLEYFEEFHKKHPSFEKFKAKHQQGQIEEPLFDQVRKYLTAGAELPDEFPIRENVVGKLVNIEFMDGNYEKAFSLLDELRTKYPHGEYGRKASGWKEELLELQKRELAQAPQPRVGGWSRLLPIFLVIAAGIVLIGLILVLKKKSSSRGKSRAT